MTFASYKRRELMHSTRTGRLLAGKSCLPFTTRFRFLGLSPILRLLRFICFFAQVWALSDKGKTTHVIHRWRKRKDSPIFIKKVFKILPLWQIATWRRNFERRAVLDCRCYGQHSHENESRTEIRSEPFIRAVFVLDKTCSYDATFRVLFKTRLIFSSYKWP